MQLGRGASNHTHYWQHIVAATHMGMHTDTYTQSHADFVLSLDAGAIQEYPLLTSITTATSTGHCLKGRRDWKHQPAAVFSSGNPAVQWAHSWVSPIAHGDAKGVHTPPHKDQSTQCRSGTKDNRLRVFAGQESRARKEMQNAADPCKWITLTLRLTEWEDLGRNLSQVHTLPSITSCWRTKSPVTLVEISLGYFGWLCSLTVPPILPVETDLRLYNGKCCALVDYSHARKGSKVGFFFYIINQYNWEVIQLL